MACEKKKLRILAPAGSVEQLIASVNNGCDAVYLGLDSFNARMKAPNFNSDNLSEWVNYCHLFGVEVYVAINTSIKNDEFKHAVELLFEAYKDNVDGVIVTDLALMRIAGALPKPFEVVASTQLNVHDKYGAEFVQKNGATTVVCARECTFENIRDIASTGIDVECFLHGAMCVCQSGQCLFSSMVGGNSGNRGLCAQPCRKLYYADDVGVSGYLLSARDMCGLNVAKELAESGATTFKIEGRNRRPEYAGMTSRIYKRLFDNDFIPDVNDFDSLAEMFNRSMASSNYLVGENSEIVYPVAQNHIGVYVGVIRNGEIAASKHLYTGDGLKVFDGNKEICGGVVLEDGSTNVKAKFGGKVSDGMLVRRTTCVKLCDEVMSTERKLDVDMKFVAKIGQKPRITAMCNGTTVEICGDYLLEKAVNSPLSATEIAKQLQKSGGTHYIICDIAIEKDDIFIAKSQLNALRRKALEELEQNIISQYNEKFNARRSVKTEEYISAKADGNCAVIETACAVVCRNESELSKARAKCEYLIYKPDIVNDEALKTAKKYDAYIDLPSFAQLDKIAETVEALGVKVLCNNVGQVEFARKYSAGYIVGGGLNIFNDCSVDVFYDADSFAYSRELTVKEIGEFNNRGGLIFVDGSIPLMQLCHCPYKLVFGCNCDSCCSDKNLEYRDELNNRFVIRRRVAGRCLFELVNGNKLSAVNKLKSAGRYIIDYDEKVLEHYLNINKGVDDGYIEMQPYTKGRLYDKIN